MICGLSRIAARLGGAPLIGIDALLAGIVLLDGGIIRLRLLRLFFPCKGGVGCDAGIGWGRMIHDRLHDCCMLQVRAENGGKV